LSSVLAAVGCGGTADTESVETTSSPLVITNCTGSAISAAVLAGGEVDLSCGTNPPPIQMTYTPVTRNTVLKALSTGITFLPTTALFDVSPNVSFEVDGITFLGFNTVNMPVHGVSSTITLNNDAFTNFSSFVVGVHENSTLNVNGCTFANNGSQSLTFAGSIYLEGSVGNVTNSTFQGDWSAQDGGAIVDFGNLTVTGSKFISNRAQVGGAIYANLAGAHLMVKASSFTNNVATQPGGGGAILFEGSTQALVQGSTFSGNSNPAVVGNVLVVP